MVAAHDTKRLLSLGRLVETFQRSPGAIRAAIDDLQIGPSLELNDVGYYSDADIDRIMCRLAERGTTRPPATPHGHAASSK